MPKRNFDNFDEYAKDYRTIHTANVKFSGADSFYFAEQKILELKKNEFTENMRMLDVGCGDGVTEIYIHRHFPSWEAEGIDISAQSISAACDREIGNTNFTIYNGTDIPFEDNSFDIVFVAAVLHHVTFSLHHTIVQNIYRALKPGGRLYLFEHNPLNPVTRYMVNTCPFDKDAKLLTATYSRRLLRRAGFKKDDLKYILFFPRKGMLSKLIAFEDRLSWLPLGGQYYFRAVK